MNKIYHRILLSAAAAILSCAVASTASFGQHSKRHRVPDHHQVKSDRSKEIDVNIPISTQHGGKGDDDRVGAGQKTLQIVPDRRRQVYTVRPSAGLSFAHRNAIGLPIVQHEVIQGESALSVGRPQTQPPGPSNGMAGFTNRSFATPQETPHPASPSLPILNRGTIGGVSLIPRRTGGVGGPSTPVGGINGTAVRPRH